MLFKNATEKKDSNSNISDSQRNEAKSARPELSFMGDKTLFKIFSCPH